MKKDRTPEESFKDGQMHEWLISHYYTINSEGDYVAPFGMPNSEKEMIEAHKRIFGEEPKKEQSK